MKKDFLPAVALAKKTLRTAFQPRFFIWTGFYTLLAVSAPLLFAHFPQNQLFTGTVVNAALFGATWQVGWLGAFWVAVLPSSAALLKGTLPLPMAVLLPFIIFSNLLLVSDFHLFPKKNLLAIFSSAGLKFIFLFSAALLFAGKIPAIFLSMLSWPQLVTALSGGLLVWLIKRK